MADCPCDGLFSVANLRRMAGVAGRADQHPLWMRELWPEQVAGRLQLPRSFHARRALIVARRTGSVSRIR